MESRRNYYRHCFEQGQGPAARLEAIGSKVRGLGEVTDMSLEGVRIRVTAGDFQLGRHDQFRIELTLPRQRQALSIRARLIHVETKADKTFAGFQCLPSMDPAADKALQAQIWQFLLEEQRSMLRARRGSRAVPKHSNR